VTRITKQSDFAPSSVNGATFSAQKRLRGAIDNFQGEKIRRRRRERTAADGLKPPNLQLFVRRSASSQTDAFLNGGDAIFNTAIWSADWIVGIGDTDLKQ